MTFERRDVPPEQAFEALKALRAEGYNVLVDFTAVDWSAAVAGASKSDASDRYKRAAPAEEDDLARPIAAARGEEYGTPKTAEAAAFQPKPQRFEAVYRLMKLNAETGMDEGRVEVRCLVPDGEPVLRSARALWPIADWLEREVWDMFGVRFVDRPDIKRLLLYDEFQGHPLRKDYPISRRQPLIGPSSGEPASTPTFNQIKPTIRYE